MYPAISMVNDQSFLIAYAHRYYTFNVYRHYCRSNIERIIWIGFYKNSDNNQCFIDKLPKDIIIHILQFIGKQLILRPYIVIDI